MTIDAEYLRQRLGMNMSMTLVILQMQNADADADAEADHINSPPLLCKLQSSSLAESSLSPSISPTAPLTH